MKVRCFGVNPKKAETVRKALLQLDAVDNEFPVTRENGLVLIPVIPGTEPAVIDNVPARIVIKEVELKPRMKRPRSYKEMLDLDDDLMDLLPSSFDLIGEIAILKLPDELSPYRQEIGDSLWGFNRNIKTVAVDNGVSGEFRIRDLEVISGFEDLETVHVENNLRFKLDPSKVYFSPRLATERMRVAEMVENETVLDMFAGVGPFSLTVARHGNAEKVVGIDLNPDSIRFFSTNITLNSLDDRVEAHLGDAREISMIFGPFDRVIMNLPHNSMDFFETALDIIEKGSIHLYRIVEEGEMMNTLKEMIKIAENHHRKIEITGTREVHNYSPTQSVMVFDIRVLG